MAMYWKFGAIKAGESKAAGHEGKDGWMEIRSMKFGMHVPYERAYGGAGPGEERGRPTVSEVTLTKVQDSDSPLIVKELLHNNHCNSEIHMTQTGSLTGKLGKPHIYTIVKLSRAMISDYSVSSEGERPIESISLHFDKIEYEYQGLGASGLPDPNLKTSVMYSLREPTT